MELTMYPSRRQRKELARELKTFAFEQSPLFQDGAIQSMETSQTFELIEKIPEGSWMPGTLQFDQMKIKLGFSATRFTSESKSEPPIYSYEAITEGTQLVHPQQLNLSDEAWVALWKKYLEDEQLIVDEEMLEGNLVHAEAVPEDMKADIIECLVDAGAECELYQKSTLNFATCEYHIESSYERGVSIENALFDSLGTHDHLEDGWEAHQTPDGELFIPPTYAPDELLIGDEIEVRNQFIDLVRAYGTDQEAAETGFLPHEHKLHEIRYVIGSLRKRRIDLV